MYEKLQEILNKCIENWWKPRGSETNQSCYKIDTHKNYIEENTWCSTIKYSYHDLFSKDSLLMEFVEWEKDSNTNQITVHWVTIMDYDVKYNYMIMSEMTSEEKIQYFIDNVVI